MIDIESLIKIYKHPIRQNCFVRTVRIVWWKINQIFINSPTIINILDNTKCICYPSSSFGSLIFYVHLPEYFEMKKFITDVENGGVVIDVGSNLGIYSLIAATFPKTKVYAFEPSRKILNNLYENININKFEKKIDVAEEIVSNHCGYERFKECDVTEISHIDTAGQKKKCISLDQFIKEKKIKSIKMLKIDVEGAEMRVLKGSEKNIERGVIKNILMEINKENVKFGTCHDEIINFLQKNGYSVKIFIENRCIPIRKFIPIQQYTYNIYAHLKQ